MITKSSFFYISLLTPSFFLISNSFLFSKKTVFSKNFMNFSFQSSHYSNSVIEQMSNMHDEYVNSWLLSILFLVITAMASPFLTHYVSKNFVSNLKVEVLWIFVPSFILLSVSAPSIDFLYNMEESQQDSIQSPYKSFGYQWYWTYEFPFSGESEFRESYMSSEMKMDFVSYMASDNEMEIPFFSNVCNSVTANDVMHSWAIPSLMIKTDAIPGRLNSVSFMVNSMVNEKHYGQCSELCGVNHSFMPIVLSTKS